jgi:hypothetical protein
MCTDRVAVAIEYHKLTAEMFDLTGADDDYEAMAMAIAFDRLAVIADTCAGAAMVAGYVADLMPRDFPNVWLPTFMSTIRSRTGQGGAATV